MQGEGEGATSHLLRHHHHHHHPLGHESLGRFSHGSSGGERRRFQGYSGGGEAESVGVPLNGARGYYYHQHQHQRGQEEGMFDAVRLYPVTRRFPHHL